MDVLAVRTLTVLAVRNMRSGLDMGLVIAMTTGAVRIVALIHYLEGSATVAVMAVQDQLPLTV
jgi:hypothetical protein